MRVSVIIPVYNAEKTLNQSLQSLLEQSSRDFEVIFVNDCSSDRSVDILEEFSSTSGLECRIVHQPENGGVAAARNKALEYARGEYLMWLDADDILSNDAVSKAVAAARQTDADIVGWDWTLGFSQNGRYMRQADYTSPMEAVVSMMEGRMRWNLWLFMVRRELVEKNRIRFIPGANMGEDMMFMIKTFLRAKSSTQIHESLYSYNAVSSSSISRQFSGKRREEVSQNLLSVSEMLMSSEYADALLPRLDSLKLFIKLPLLMSSDKENYVTWYDWMPEANGAAMANKTLPFRTRLVQWMAARRLWLGVKAYYVFVYKFVYGLIYR